MGDILEFKCPQCGYQTKLFVGGGMRDCERETALAAVPNNKELAAALNNNAWFQINRKPGVCRRCHKLVSTTYVTYQPKGMRKRNIPQPCPDCGGMLDWLAVSEDGTPCPACGWIAPLVSIGLWD